MRQEQRYRREAGLETDSFDFWAYVQLFSADKPVDVWVTGAPQLLVFTAENDLALAKHDHLCVDEAEAFALLLEIDCSVFLNNSIFRGKIIEVVHFVGHEYG